MKTNWNLPLNPGGIEPKTNEEINTFHIEQWKKHGLKFVKIFTGRDQHRCEYCASMHGVVIPIDQAIEIPMHKCTSPTGCRCYYQPTKEIPAKP